MNTTTGQVLRLDLLLVGSTLGVGIGLWLFVHIFMDDPGAAFDRVLQMGH